MEEPVDIPARSKPMPYITKTLTVSLKEATEQENN
jgi:hypothetical protein